ncbi:LapA family protein [Pseudonocardia phyllosphaerae]|uniref:LapA family protein n=1 Tax=Pseudonocardia phyllosphaerae TaxID=3390502 RepID=UPI003979543D
MSDDRTRENSPSWGRVGPEDPSADPATKPAMTPERTGGAHARPEEPTTAIPTGEPGGQPSTGEHGTPQEPAGKKGRTKQKAPKSRTGGLWAGLILSALVLIILLIFIAQNTAPAQINFLGYEGELPTGVALLFAAIAGIVLVAIPGSIRIAQLRRAIRKAG